MAGVMVDAASGEIWGAAGLVVAATVTGWFGLRARGQEREVVSTKDEAQGAAAQMATALDLVRDLMAQVKSKDAEIASLRKRLDGAPGSHRR